MPPLRPILCRSAASLLVLLTVGSCAPNQSTLEQIIAKGEIWIATRNGPTTYYEGPEGPAGFEYELLHLFADRLHVELKLVTPNNFSDIIPMVAAAKVDLAAAGLTVTDKRQRIVRFSKPYQAITQQLVYHKST